jgi:hypothetical protein
VRSLGGTPVCEGIELPGRRADRPARDLLWYVYAVSRHGSPGRAVSGQRRERNHVKLLGLLEERANIPRRWLGIRLLSSDGTLQLSFGKPGPLGVRQSPCASKSLGSIRVRFSIPSKALS